MRAAIPITRYLPRALILLVLFISSCGTISRMPSKKPKPPPDIDFPDKDAEGHKIEEGRASWYGSKFDGRRTANGEAYDMNQLTAAHRTLPFNSIVKVKNLDNNKTVMVRINDRGPFAKGRIIDLSKKAAQDIGLIANGTARVALILMGKDKLQKDFDLKKAQFTIQLGSFSSKGQALKLSRRIKDTRVVPINLSQRKVYRVYYGTYHKKGQARKQQQELRNKGYSGFVKQLQT